MSTPEYQPVVYPSWWSSAATVMVKTNDDGDAIFDVGDVELLPYGVSTPAGGLEGGTTWAACVHPWATIYNLNMNS